MNKQLSKIVTNGVVAINDRINMEEFQTEVLKTELKKKEKNIFDRMVKNIDTRYWVFEYDY